MSYSTLAKIERGAIQSPSVFTVANIAAVTGVSVEDLLGIKTAGPADAGAKKVSKSGVRFVYFDIGGTLLQSHHWAFTKIAQDHNLPVDKVENSYWRHRDEVETGQITLAKFNDLLGKELGIKNLDWWHYELEAAKPVTQSKELLKWVAQNYKLGLLTNIKPGLLPKLRAEGLLPDVDFDAVIDSSVVGFVKPQPQIYKLAQKDSGVDAKEILLVDNERPNLVAADRAGWQTVWFNELDPTDSAKRIKEALEF